MGRESPEVSRGSYLLSTFLGVTLAVVTLALMTRAFMFPPLKMYDYCIALKDFESSKS
jgi:hypothetical protein